MAKHRISTCDSAQLEVFKRLSQGEEDVMVFCDHQLKGEGRRSRPWFSSERSIAMSFGLAPCAKLSLTSLELGALVCDFLEKRNIKAKLKWPNDICLMNGKKCGGILIQSKKGSLVAGIGLNLFHPSDKIPSDLREKMGCLFEKSNGIDPWNFSLELYDYIVHNRLTPTEVVKNWSARCGHLRRKVVAKEDGEEITGLFVGIGEDGEALIETALEIKRVYNASLFVL